MVRNWQNRSLTVFAPKGCSMVVSEVTNVRTRKKKDEYAEKWVDCLNCLKQYVVEPVINAGCPVCGSREFEESTGNEYASWGE